MVTGEERRAIEESRRESAGDHRNTKISIARGRLKTYRGSTTFYNELVKLSAMSADDLDSGWSNFSCPPRSRTCSARARGLPNSFTAIVFSYAVPAENRTRRDDGVGEDSSPTYRETSERKERRETDAECERKGENTLFVNVLEKNPLKRKRSNKIYKINAITLETY